MKEPIIFWHYFDLSDPVYFCDLLQRYFMRTGHDREIIFRKFNCYKELPAENADLITYDALCTTALADKGLIRPLPKEIGTDGIFEWILDTGTVKGERYGLPFIICTNSLICRKEDYTPVSNVYELEGKVSAPMQSMLYYYWIQSFCSYQDGTESVMNTMKLIRWLMGGSDAFSVSKLTDREGIDRFISGESRWLIGFTEHIRHLEKREYVVSVANFSETDVNQFPMFFVDQVSVGAGMTEEKRQDCLDLIGIIGSDEFQYDLFQQDGELQYMLPAKRSLYKRLAELDGIYDQFYELVAREDNCTFRYGKDFYETVDKAKDYLTKMFE